VKLFAGTSGYSYPSWKGGFYPRDVGDTMLAYYASKLPAVEINNTFYKRPSTAQLEAWAKETPAAFKLAFKASRYFSAGTGLRDKKAIADFFALLSATKTRLGPVLVQLPRHLKKDVGLLADVVATPHRVALDLVDPSWRTDDVRQLLSDHDVALCATEDDENSAAFVQTAQWGYFRLRKSRYDARAIAKWAARLRETSLGEAYVFFKHDDAGPTHALALLAATEGS
jgi:uncharacterized protein YecE (DUF72 family)